MPRLEVKCEFDVLSLVHSYLSSKKNHPRYNQRTSFDKSF